MAARHTLLVVDDEPDVVKSVQDLLRLDYKVFGATSAHDGLRVLQEHEVHIVMTDQRMPEMTGVEFLRQLRGEHPEAIRLLFTGYADIKAVIDAINQGNVYRYISKPWDPDELQTIIKQAAEHYDLLVERKRLLQQLQAKNQELEAANVELLRANELKHAFIKVASHELRTPLTILLGLTELASRTPGLAEPLTDWLRRIDNAGQRLNRLIDQMIKLLMSERFERTLERQPTDLAKLLVEAADDVRPFVELRRQQLSLEAAPDLGLVPVDAAKIRDSVDHLLLNAIKFTPDGGRIGISAGPRSGGGAQIRVADNGVGIDPACLPHIFNPFFTSLDVSRHCSGKFEYGRQGLGLGLSVVKAFIEMHGGKIDVASELGKGTTFTITLPDGTPATRPGSPSWHI